jgi:hypothetical protein
MLKAVDVAAQCVNFGAQCDQFATAVKFKYQNGDPN